MLWYRAEKNIEGTERTKNKKNKKSQQLKSGTSIAKTCKVIDMYLRHISNPYWNKYAGMPCDSTWKQGGKKRKKKKKTFRNDTKRKHMLFGWKQSVSDIAHMWNWEIPKWKLQ